QCELLDNLPQAAILSVRGPELLLQFSASKQLNFGHEKWRLRQKTTGILRRGRVIANVSIQIGIGGAEANGVLTNPPSAFRIIISRAVELQANFAVPLTTGESET